MRLSAAALAYGQVVGRLLVAVDDQARNLLQLGVADALADRLVAIVEIDPEPGGSQLVSASTPAIASASRTSSSPACAALLASLAAADANLRCEIATALGKLGDKAALGPLERHMGDKDIRVRRAVATALVQLGHPKGETLLGIAERMPASSVLMLANPPAKIKKSSGGGGGSIDQPTLIKVGGGLLAAAVIGGGIWMWMNSSPAPRGKGKKAKSAATKTAPAGKSKPKATPAADAND